MNFSQELIDHLLGMDQIKKLIEESKLEISREDMSIQSRQNVFPNIRKVTFDDGDETPIDIQFTPDTPVFEFYKDENFKFVAPRISPEDTAKLVAILLNGLFGEEKTTSRVTKYTIADSDEVLVNVKDLVYHGVAKGGSMPLSSTALPMRLFARKQKIEI